MPQTKLFELPYSLQGKTTIYGIIKQRLTGYFLDYSTGLFAAVPVNKFNPTVEDSVLKGVYVISEARYVWTDGNYFCMFYDQIGAAPAPDVDTVLGSATLTISADAEVVSPDIPTGISICNNAILTLGGNVITTFDDTSTEGVLCKAFWSDAVYAVLRLHPWNFAVKRAALTPDVTGPLYEWTYAFTLPVDLVRILDLDGVVEYKVEGRKILCDDAALNIRYVYRNISTDEWDAVFVEAMAAYMAFKLAYPLTKSNSTRDVQWKLFTELLRTAKAVDAQEEPGETMGDFPFLRVRG